MTTKNLGGYMLIYRKMLNNPLWLSEPFTKAQAWIDLLFLANYEDSYIVVGNGENIPIKRGQCAWSQRRLAQRWKWSRGKVEQYFKHLIEQRTIQRIEQGKIGRKTTIINILNYEKYQGRATNQAMSQAQDCATNRALYKEVNKENKELIKRKDNNTTYYYPKEKKSNFQIPKIEEIQTYCIERNNNIDTEYFYDYYESNGWHVGKSKMKDWKAAVRNWERNQKFNKTENQKKESEIDGWKF